MKILVLSCDKNTDLFPLYKHCIEKYWPNHPEVIYSTETLTNPFYKTICKDYPLSSWTKRIRETVEEIDDDYILIMCDDLFIRKPVTEDFDKLCERFTKGNFASINLEKSFDKTDIPFGDNLLLRSDSSKYRNSCLCSLWYKPRLIKVFTTETSPWGLEQNNETFDFKYLILKDYIIHFEDPKTKWRWGLVRKGKWTREARTFFDSEGIKIDYSKRGFIK